MNDLEKLINVEIFSEEGPYLLIGEDMDQLHDYCIKIFNLDLKVRVSLYPPSESETFEDVSVNEGAEYEHVKQQHEEYKTFYIPSTILMLIYIFFEKSLNTICYGISKSQSWYMIPEGIKYRIKNDQRTFIDSALKHLKDELNIDVNLTEEQIDYIHKIRMIRNDYAHGDWDNVKKKITDIDITNAFRIVSEILLSISKSDPNNWINNP